MTRAVIFDIDGTLIDSVDVHAHAWRETFLQYGKDIPFEDVRAQIGKGGDQLMPVFFPRAELKRIGKEMEQFRTRLFQAKYLPRVRPFPRVKELFERLLQDRLRIAVATSAKEDELHAYLSLAGIEDFIDEQTSSDDARRSKPHPDIFAAALAKLEDVAPEDAVVIGDTPYDAEAAGKLGLTTIGVLCGGFPEDSLRTAGCAAIFRDPADLLDRYEESPIRQQMTTPA